MSKEQLIAEILQLPPDERQDVIHIAIDSLPEAYVIDPAMTPELRTELERRYANMLAHPERESSWKDVSARLLARKSKKQ